MQVREAAVAALISVMIERHKADAVLERLRGQIEARDTGLLQQIVYGVLRHYYSLEADISRFIREKPDETTRLALLAGSYQLRHLRVPAHAAVAETVAAVKRLAPKDAGFVNAVLRKVAAAEPPAKLKPYQRAELPKWLYAGWREAFGDEAVQGFAAMLQTPPPLAVAVFGDRDAWMNEAGNQGIEARAGELSSQAVLLPSGTDVTSLPGFATGDFTVMDQAAQHAAQALDVQPGDVVLDLCAAPGGKTALLARNHPEAQITAVELSEARIPRLQENLARLQVQNVAIQQGDATALPFEDGSIDAILLDAPCTASGVLRRHPDAKFIHDPASVARHAGLQKKMVAEALRILKPGGRLLYAVCSINPAENEQVVEGLAGLQSTERLLPSATHDGFFIAVLEKS